VRKHLWPVAPFVPRDLGGRIDFDRHHLTSAATLDQHHSSADPTGTPAAFLAALDIGRHERVA
jgi:hypothetical protein